MKAKEGLVAVRDPAGAGIGDNEVGGHHDKQTTMVCTDKNLMMKPIVLYAN